MSWILQTRKLEDFDLPLRARVLKRKSLSDVYFSMILFCLELCDKISKVRLAKILKNLTLQAFEELERLSLEPLTEFLPEKLHGVLNAHESEIVIAARCFVIYLQCVEEKILGNRDPALNRLMNDCTQQASELSIWPEVAGYFAEAYNDLT